MGGGPARRRERLIEAALQRCIAEGYPSLTMAGIAQAAAVALPEAVAVFPTPQDAVLATVEDILHAIAAALPDAAAGTDPVEVLRATTTRVLADIAAGSGPLKRDRLAQLGRVLTATPSLRGPARTLRHAVLIPALARHLGLPVADRAVTHAVTMWSAVIGASYNPPSRRGQEPEPDRDGRRPEVMVQRLNATFPRILGPRIVGSPPSTG